MPSRPRAVAFDVVQTLMSLEPLRPRFVDIGLHEALLERWFDRLIRDGMALTLAGDYAPFPAVAAQALRAVGGHPDDESIQHVLAGFAELTAQPDAEPAMRVLADSGITMVCLSNGVAQTTSDFLARSSLDRYIDQVISIDEVRKWKPHRDVYEHALRCVAHPGEDVALVAVHAWDCHGARRAGLTTGWASRLEGEVPETFAQPDVVGADLVDVARGLIALG